MKVIKTVMLILLLGSVLTVAFKVTPVKAQFVLIGPIEIHSAVVELYNLTLYGPITYGDLQIMNFTADLAKFSNMLLIGYLPNGSKLEVKASNANATKLMIYAPYVSLFGGGIVYNATWLYYENRSIYISPTYLYSTDVYMKAVYLQAESFFIIPWLLGDVNGDGIVDILDVVIWANAFGSQPGDPKWNPLADLNQDGIIDIFDAVIIGVNFGKTV